MAKVSKATVESQRHDDGAVSHKIRFVDGTTRVVLIKSGHPLTQHFVEHGSKAKLLAAINSVDDVKKAVEKIDALDAAFEGGKWGLQNESAGTKATSLVQAYANVRKVDLEVAEAYVKSLSKADQAKLRGHPLIAVEIVALEASERIDAADELLFGKAEKDREEAA